MKDANVVEPARAGIPRHLLNERGGVDVERLKAEVSITAVAAEATDLQNVGTELRGLCPLHDENTPSFHVNEGNRIERRTIGSIATLVLVGRPPQARIPALRILWSVDLPNEQARDALFDWCIDRAARWDDWAALAYRRGGAALTRLMLAMVAAERASAADTDGERGRDDDGQIRRAAIEHLK